MPDPIHILSAAAPSKIAVYSKPPVNGGHRKYLTMDEFNTEIGIDYSEGLFVDSEETLNKLKSIAFKHKLSIPYAKLQRQIEQRLSEPFSGLAITWINDDVGYGVIAEEDIPVETVLCIYSGIVKSNEQYTSSDHYCMAVDSNTTLHVTANDIRGMAGFMQHLPQNNTRLSAVSKMLLNDDSYLAEVFEVDIAFIKAARKTGRISDAVIEQVLAYGETFNHAADKEWEEIKFISDEVENSVACSNVVQELIPYKGIYVLAMVTQLPIKKGEMVGISYTTEYWKKEDHTPQLFSKYGQIVPRSLYQPTMFCLHITGDGTSLQKFVDFDKKYLLQFIKTLTPLVTDSGAYYSQFEMRQRLTDSGALAKCYGELPADTLVGIIEREFADTSIKTSTFWRNPHLVHEGSKDERAYDSVIVCRAKNENDWQSVNNFFKARQLPVKCSKKTREVILTDCNSKENREEYREKLSLSRSAN